VTGRRTADPTRDAAGSFRDCVAGGAAAALVGIVAFGIFHTVWIRNVPAVFLEGLLYGIPACFGIAWAFRSARRAGRFGGGVRSGLLFGVCTGLTLLPYEVVGVLWGPWQLPASPGEILAVLWIAFLGVPVGAAIGWVLGRRARAAIAWGVAALSVDFSLGGAIAFFGGRGRFLGLFLWLVGAHLLAGAALVAVHDRVARRKRIVTEPAT